MSGHEILKPAPFLETLTEARRNILLDLANFRVKKIVYDLDNTLGDAEEVVKIEFDNIFGTNYRERRINRFDALSLWAQEDGVTTFKHAQKVEERLWTDRELLSKILPYPEMQEYSRKAAELGIFQFIDTSRTGRLRKPTFNWTGIHYPWIPQVNVKITRRRNVRYDIEHKTKTIVEIGPDFVVDDNPEHILIALRSTQQTRFVWFALGQDLSLLDDERVVALPGGPQQYGLIMSHNLIDTFPTFC